MHLRTLADERGIATCYWDTTITGGAMATHAYTATSVCRVLIGLVVLWGMISLPALGRCADDGDFARATLRGLQGVSVLIEDLPPESERAGLTTQQL